jgi:hypothetical protein
MAAQPTTAARSYADNVHGSSLRLCLMP